MRIALVDILVLSRRWGTPEKKKIFLTSEGTKNTADGAIYVQKQKKLCLHIEKKHCFNFLFHTNFEILTFKPSKKLIKKINNIFWSVFAHGGLFSKNKPRNLSEDRGKRPGI